MKRLNIIFISFVAVLLFYVTWNAFNVNYSIRQTIFNSQDLVSGEKREINTVISTHVLDFDMDEIKRELVKFYVSYDYEGFITHISIGEDLRESVMVYAYLESTDDPFEFYTVPDKTNIDFKDPNEHQYITNDLSLNNSINIDYLDARYYSYRDDYERSLINIHPLHNFLSSDNSKIQDAQLSVTFYVEEIHVDEAIRIFQHEILEPFGIMLEGQEDHEGFILDSTEMKVINLENASLSGLRWHDSMLEMPKPLLLIAGVSLFFTNIYLIFSRAKEIYVRKMHGNSDRVVFKKVALGTFIQTVFAFILTFFVLWLIYVHSMRPLAILYTRQLLLIIAIYILLMFVVAMVLFGYLHFKNSILFLKKRLDMSFIFTFATIFKLLGVTLVVVPLVINFKSWQQFESGIKAIEDDPVYLKSIGLQGITQPIYPQTSFDLHLKTQEWYEFTHDSILSLIESQNMSFIDMDYYDVNASYDPSYTVAPFAVTNLNHVSNYPMTIGGEVYDFSKHEENFILVPTDKLADFKMMAYKLMGLNMSQW